MSGTTTTTSTPPLQPAADDLVGLERKRTADIMAIGTRARMNASAIEKAVLDGVSAYAFRARAFDAMVSESERTAPGPLGQLRDDGASLDNPREFRQAAADAMLARIRGVPAEGMAASIFADGEAAFARRVLSNAGTDVRGWTDQRVMRSYHTTHDFNLIAGAVANVRLVETFTAAASPIMAVFGKRKLPDFKTHTEAKLDWTTFLIRPVNEHGEFQSSTIEENGESYRLFTEGGVFGLTRYLLINAHGALDDLFTPMGQSCAEKEAISAVAFIEQAAFAGPKMSDGKPVFYTVAGDTSLSPQQKAAFGTGRDNIETLTIGDPAETAMQLMALRAKAARRKGKGNVIVGAFPKIWVVHPDFEGYAMKVVAQVQAATVADVNPAAGRFTIVSEPRLADPNKSWLVVEPNIMTDAVKANLEGQETPFTDSRVGFEVDGVEFKLRHDWGYGFLEWRSWTRLDHVEEP